MKSPLPGAPCDQCTKSDDIWQQISCSTHDGQRVRHQFLKSKDDNDNINYNDNNNDINYDHASTPANFDQRNAHTHTKYNQKETDGNVHPNTFDARRIMIEVYNKCMAEIYGLYGISKTTMARITWIIQSSSNPWNGPVPQLHILLLFLMAWKRAPKRNSRGDWTLKRALESFRNLKGPSYHDPMEI